MEGRAQVISIQEGEGHLCCAALDVRHAVPLKVCNYFACGLSSYESCTAKARACDLRSYGAAQPVIVAGLMPAQGLLVLSRSPERASAKAIKMREDIREAVLCRHPHAREQANFCSQASQERLTKNTKSAQTYKCPIITISQHSLCHISSICQGNLWHHLGL